MKVAKAMHKYLTKSKYIFLPLPYQKEVLLKKINQGLRAKTAILSGVFLCMLDIKIVCQVPSNHYHSFDFYSPLNASDHICSTKVF